PIDYIDDDLFGYMVAGATESGEGDDESSQTEGRIFEAENIEDAHALRAKLLDSSRLSRFLLEKFPDRREVLQNSESSEPEVQGAMLDVLDEAARSDALSKLEGIGDIPGTKQLLRKLGKTKSAEELHQFNKELLLKAFAKDLQAKQKRPTTRRTAPVRMHALVAFSGIKTARDFQTFSRYVPYTGEDSVLNPNSPGIYSGWLKTRILIESNRIGKFYIGENMDILEEQLNGRQFATEQNPYSRELKSVKYIELDPTERTSRMRAVLRALANIGNTQGPASGALHDGSLRPKAFVAGVMNCADSPFDYIWVGHNDDSMPYLDVGLLCDSVKDWEDLFAVKKIY